MGESVQDNIAVRGAYNAVSDFVDANVARGVGKKVAFVDPGRSLTYHELQARSIRFAHALHGLGLEQEDRVALLMHDTVDYPVAFWGTIRAGIVAIPLNTYLPVPQYNYILADSRASVLVATASLAQSIWPIVTRLPYLKTVILVDAKKDAKADFSGREVHGFEDILAKSSAEPFTANTVSDEVAFWLYTSGSTGDPKGVKHIHSSLLATAKLFGQGVLGIREDDVVHSASKLFFAYGLGNAMTFPLSVGATAALWPHRPSPEGVFEIMRMLAPAQKTLSLPDLMTTQRTSGCSKRSRCTASFNSISTPRSYELSLSS